MQLLHPSLLWLALGLMLLIYIPRKDLKGMNPRQRVLHNWPMLVGFIGAFFLFGLAGPQIVNVHYFDAVRPASIIGMLDNSGSVSMRIATRPDVYMSNGYIVNREDEVEVGKAFRENFAKFANKRNDDVVGLTMFGEQAYSIMAPALNNGVAIEDALKNYHEPNEGTNFPHSLNAVLDQFEKTPADHDRILLIATDGQFDINLDEAEALKKRIKDLNVTVYMIVGGDRLDSQVVKDGHRDGVKLVTDVASEDNILFAGDGAAVAKAFRLFDRLEPQNWEVRENRTTMDMSWMPLATSGLMFLIMLGVFIFGNRKPKSEDDGTTEA